MGFNIGKLNPFGGRGNPFGAIKNEINSIKNKVEHLPKEIDQLKRTVNQFPKELTMLKDKVEDLPKEFKNELWELKGEIDDLPDKIKQELLQALGSAVGAAIKRGLTFGYHELKDNISILKGVGIHVDFSVFTSLLSGGFSVKWTGFKERLTKAEQLAIVLHKYKDKDLRKRSDIIDFVKIVVPDELGISISAVSLDLDVYEGLNRFNYYLGKVGVPD